MAKTLPTSLSDLFSQSQTLSPLKLNPDSTGRGQITRVFHNGTPGLGESPKKGRKP